MKNNQDKYLSTIIAILFAISIMLFPVGIICYEYDNKSQAFIDYDTQYKLKLENEYNINNYLILNSSEINRNILEHRADNNKYPIIIEKIIGIVVNSELDGRIINTQSRFNYISYREVKNVQNGDIVVTYVCYSRDNYIDSIMFRDDYIV